MVEKNKSVQSVQSVFRKKRNTTMTKIYDRKAMKPVMPPTDAEDIEWRDVVGFEGRYEVSNYGHVRTIPHYVDNHTGRILLKARLLRPNVLRKGYLQVTISDGDYRRHNRRFSSNTAIQ